MERKKYSYNTKHSSNKGLKRGTEFSEGSKTSPPLVKGVAWGVAWDAPVRKGRRWMEGDGLGKEEQEEFQRVTHGRNSRSIKEPHLVSILKHTEEREEGK